MTQINSIPWLVKHDEIQRKKSFRLYIYSMQFDKITTLLVTICSMISFQSWGQFFFFNILQQPSWSVHLNLNQTKAKTKDVKTNKNKQELQTDTIKAWQKITMKVHTLVISTGSTLQADLDFNRALNNQKIIMVFVQLNLSLCKYRTVYKNDKFLNIFVQSLHTWI